LLLYLALVVYGSLLPFQLRPPPTAGAWEAFLRLPYLQLGVGSRADWVANLLLYIPLGFLTVGWAQGRSAANPIHGLAALIVVGAIAVGVEYAQIFFAPRTVSMNDLAAEWLGAAIGVALWYATHHRLARLLADTLGRGRVALRAAILLYLAAYVALAVFPFDFLVSLTELRWRLSTESWGILFAPAGGGGVLRRALQLVVDAAAMVPLGVLIATGAPSATRPAVRRAAMAGAGLGLLIEVLQFLTASGISQGASVVARSAGAALGVWLSARAPGWAIRPVPAWVRPALLLALPLYGVVLAVLNGWLDASWLSFEQAVGRLKPTVFLPFYYHYFTSESEAMQSLVANGLMYGLVGIGAWLFAVAGGSRPIASVAVAVAAGLAAVIELGKFFAPGKHADPTNVLIAGVSAAAAFLLARWLHRTLASPVHAVTGGAREVAAAAGQAVGPQAAEARALGTAHGGAAVVTPSVAAIWPRDPAGWARLAGGVALLLVAAVVLTWFPAWRLALGAALVAYAWALWRDPSIWLIAIPALLPSLDLATRTGWYFVDELDLFLLVTVGIALLRPAAGEAPAPLPRRAVLLLGLFAASYAVATLRGLLPLSPLDLNALSSPYSAFESLRVAKGVIWAFALLPFLQRAFASPVSAGRYLVTGMTVGLLLAGAAVFHERLVFTGLFDFSTDFRATGVFSGMNTGGSEIEAYLVMALPFALLSLTQRRRWYSAVLGLGAFTLGGYALLVTFARGGYAAGALGLLVAALGLFVARRRGPGSARPWRRLAGIGMASAIVALLAVVAVSAPYMAGRFMGTAGDFETRWSHWADAVRMMDDDWKASLFGMGVGRFPETYFWATTKNDQPGTFAFAEREGNRFLRLGGGDPLYLRQKVHTDPHAEYRLSLVLRSDQPGAGLRVYLCEQTLLYSGRCHSQLFAVGGAGESWQRAEASIAMGEIGSGHWLAQRPVYLGLSHGTGESLVEVDNVKLVSRDGVDLLRNGDFEGGFDFWFFAVDGHLAWHIKNLWLTVLFEQGWSGVVAFGVLIVSAVIGIGASVIRGSRVSAVILAAVFALLAIGLLESPLDFPRIALLFFLLLFAGMTRSSIDAR
jgi:VanZ family protein